MAGDEPRARARPRPRPRPRPRSPPRCSPASIAKSDYYRGIHSTMPVVRIGIRETPKIVKRSPFRDTVYRCNAPRNSVLTQQSTLPMCTVAYTSA